MDHPSTRARIATATIAAAALVVAGLAGYALGGSGSARRPPGGVSRARLALAAETNLVAAQDAVQAFGAAIVGGDPAHCAAQDAARVAASLDRAPMPAPPSKALGLGPWQSPTRGQLPLTGVYDASLAAPPPSRWALTTGTVSMSGYLSGACLSLLARTPASAVTRIPPPSLTWLLPPDRCQPRVEEAIERRSPAVRVADGEYETSALRSLLRAACGPSVPIGPVTVSQGR
ncbi:MAG: hypothetical protein DLM63_10795 [Solirubrobacterales bacterium]|nr:MAG: hypothetical protein DLM63_10795 [Solirubrobacterales bacterium]